MNNIQVFNFERNDIRTVMVDNEPYFVGKDVAGVLGYARPTKAIQDHCKGVLKQKMPTSSGIQELSVIPASDVLILTSKAHIVPEELRMKFTAFLVDNGWIEDRLFYNTSKEIEFVNALCQLLEPFGCELIPQFGVLNYKVDLYIKDLNVVIEYDEREHSHYSYEQHEGRQLEIEKELNCSFIRVSDRETHLWNCGFIIKEIKNRLP